MSNLHRRKVSFGVLIYIILLFSNCSDKKISEERIEEIIRDTAKFEAAAKLVREKIDTSFYALYRIKEGNFFFNYISNDSIGAFFSISDSVNNEITKSLRKVDIAEMYKYGSENFIRFNLVSEFRERVQVMVLDESEPAFAYKAGSLLHKVDSTTSIKELLKDDRKVLILNNSIRIYRYKIKY